MRLDMDTANRAFGRWLDEVANVRIHGTTGERPFVRLAVEQAVMLPLPRQVPPAEIMLPRVSVRPLPVENLQYPLSVTDQYATLRRPSDYRLTVHGG